jgi:DNA-binding MarR family transcriptional regulator
MFRLNRNKENIRVDREINLPELPLEIFIVQDGELSAEKGSIHNLAGVVVQEFQVIFRKLYSLYQLFASQWQISGSQLAAMEKLYRSEGLTIGELSVRMGLSASTTTGLVDRLERDGFASRIRDNDDRRVVRVFLTAEGRELMVRKSESGKSYSSDITGKLTVKMEQEDIRQLVNLLKKFRVTISEDSMTDSGQE